MTLVDFVLCPAVIISVYVHVRTLHTYMYTSTLLNYASVFVPLWYSPIPVYNTHTHTHTCSYIRTCKYRLMTKAESLRCFRNLKEVDVIAEGHSPERDYATS